MKSSANNSTRPVKYFEPAIGEPEISAVAEVMRSGWLTTGATTNKFEELFASAVGADHAVALNSATAALHLALVALGIGTGDEVLVPTLTFAATAEVVFYVGATPVLCDVEPSTLNISLEDAESRITERTAAIMPVHYGGQSVDLNGVRSLAAKHGLAIIEDAAHAFPASYEGEPIGSKSTAACFSFYANKTITTGEGGMLVTNSVDIANRVRRLSLHGLSRDAWRRWDTAAKWEYDIAEIGYKTNLTDIASAIGIVQLDKAEHLRAKRQLVAEIYTDRLDSIAATTTTSVTSPEDCAWHIFPLLLEGQTVRDRRDSLIDFLGSREIGTSVHYKPLHLHSAYLEKEEGNSYPVSDRYFDTGLSLPIHPGMSTEDTHRVMDLVEEFQSKQSDG